MNLQDKVVVITGGSQGFGEALARAFISAGSTVVISSDNQTALEAAAAKVGCDKFAADVTQYDQVAALAEYARTAHGRIDIWINNAGIQIAPSNTEDVDLDKLHQLFDINFFGYFYGCKAVLPILKQQDSGLIINVNSTAGLDGKPGLSAYVSSKFAIKGLTLSIREELAKTGSNVQIHGIHPGGMQTEIYREQYPSDFGEYMSVDYAVEKVIANLTSNQPDSDLLIRRP